MSINDINFSFSIETLYYVVKFILNCCAFHFEVCSFVYFLVCIVSTFPCVLFTNVLRGCGGLVVKAADSGARGWEFEPHSGHRVVLLSKAHLLPKSTGNTQEAVAPSQDD